MSFQSDFSGLLKDQVSLADITGRNDFGKPTFGAAVSYSCRIVHNNKLVRDRTGSDVVSTSQVWLTYVESTTVESQITMPDGSTPPILNIEKFPDESGSYYMKVYLSQWPR